MLVQLTQDFLSYQAGTTHDVGHDEAVDLVRKGVARLPNRYLNAKINGALRSYAAARAGSRKHAARTIFGKRGEGDPWHSFGDFCLAVQRQDRAYLEKHYELEIVSWSAKGPFGETSGVTGGYAVPVEFQSTILALAEERSLVRPLAYVQPMTAETVQIPYPDLTTTPPAGVSPFFGGVQMSWTAENQTLSETEPQFRQLELQARELGGHLLLSNTLAQDGGVGLEELLLTLFGRALAWYEDFAFFQGTGAGQPLGLLNAPAAVNVTRAASGSIKFTDIATMASRLLPSSYGDAVWAFSPTAVPQLLQLQDGANRAAFLGLGQGATARPVWKLLNFPAYCTEKLPALGTRGDLVLFDPSLYVIGDRNLLTIDASPHTQFLRNQTDWRIVTRVDGKPWFDRSITLQDGSTQVSPVVVLN